jgi:hypothetical protein
VEEALGAGGARARREE